MSMMVLKAYNYLVRNSQIPLALNMNVYEWRSFLLKFIYQAKFL